MTEKGIMGFYINMGHEGFGESRSGEYADKSGLIAFVNARLDTEQKLICVIRGVNLRKKNIIAKQGSDKNGTWAVIVK